jgi:hypothetical protein
VAVIDDVVARRFFSNADPLGHVLQFRGIERTVVGVIDQPRLYNVHSDDRGQVFVPHSQLAASGMSVAIRSSRDPAALLAMVRDVVRDIDPRPGCRRARHAQEGPVTRNVRPGCWHLRRAPAGPVNVTPAQIAGALEASAVRRVSCLKRHKGKLVDWRVIAARYRPVTIICCSACCTRDVQ